MTGRTPAEAVDTFTWPLRQAIACVSRAVADVAGGYFPSVESHSFMLNRGEPVRLRGESRVHLDLTVLYQIVERTGQQYRWQVVTTGYYYTLMDANQREIVGFHWHPVGRSPIVEPHLHLGPGAQIGYERLHRAHVPTGPVSIQDVLRFAIVDLGVEPLIDLETALQILATTPEP